MYHSKVDEAATQRAALTMATDQLRRMLERTARPELHQHIDRVLFFLSNINPERLIAPDDELALAQEGVRQWQDVNESNVREVERLRTDFSKLSTENQELKNMLAKARGF